MNRKPGILIVEDETAIRSGLMDVLIYHGYDVEPADNGHDGLNAALSGKFDLILLDVMLPGLDGFEICRRIREHDKNQSIIMLTAKSADDDIIEGLTLGADDYVSKPFSVAQLVLRIQAVLRRSGIISKLRKNITLSEKIIIDTENLSGNIRSNTVAFTRREIEVLQYLKSNEHRAVPREELLHKVWGYHKSLEIETRTVDIHIAKLRRKIETDPKQAEHLITVRGAGYRLLAK